MCRTKGPSQQKLKSKNRISMRTICSSWYHLSINTNTTFSWLSARTTYMIYLVLVRINSTPYNVRGASPRRADARLGSAHTRNYRRCRQIEAGRKCNAVVPRGSKINRVWMKRKKILPDQIYNCCLLCLFVVIRVFRTLVHSCIGSPV